MDFERICMIFTMQEPYYGILLSSMDRNPESKIETIGVGRSGNTFKLVYNPDFVDNLPVDTVLEILKHEMLHVAFNHFTLWESGPENEQEATMRNAAGDLEINGYLDRSKISAAAGGLFPEDFGWDKFLGTREYYNLLQQKEQPQQSQQAKSPSKPCNGGSQQKPQNSVSEDFTNELEQKAFDDHSLWPKDMTESEREIFQQTIDELVAFAADEVEKGRGEIPGELKGRINALRNKKKPRPVADWKRYFRRYIGNEFSEFIRKSKKRESRRFPDAAGNRHRRKSNILVGIDTSGSVSMPEYMEFMGQLRTLSETSNFHVLECDARIQYEYDYKLRPNETLHGGGGTAFEPVFDYYKQHRKQYEAVVYFTDGGAPIPHDIPKETLWVISSRGNKDRQRYKVNGASVVFIPDKQK
jgi:predicted metal-dependent peptidase